MATNANGDLLDGLWIIPHFGDEGAYYMVEEDYLRENAQARNGGEYYIPGHKLGSLIKRLLPLQYSSPEILDILDLEEIRTWITDNPLAVYEVTYGDGRERWYKDLRNVVIRCGMILLWRGTIITSVPDIEAVKQHLRSAEAKVEKLEWPSTSLIRIEYTHKKTFEPAELVLWGQLTGEIEEVVSADDEETVSEESATDPAEALRTIKSLLDDGLITHEEFAIKRTEILNRI